MKRLLGRYGMAVGVVIVSLTFAVLAFAAVSDVIVLQSKGYSEHTRKLVEFTHKKHVDDYKIACGDCHHDNKGKPLNNIKLDSKVEKCSDCHSIPGERPRGKEAPQLSRTERLEYHAEAMHFNCRDCHRDHNKAQSTKAAPTACNDCHTK